MPDYRAIAAQDAAKYGLDPAIFSNQIGQESGFNPNARSGAGALGIAQFMPGTAAGYHVNPMDPVAALDAAARMDKENLQRYGSYARMLSAYNSGRPDAYLDPHFANGQTFNYVKNIMRGRTPAAPGSTAVPSDVKATSPGVSSSVGPNAQTNALLTALKMNGADPIVLRLLGSRLGGGSTSLGPAPSVLPGGAGSGNGQSLVQTAMSQLGKPYQWGGPAVLGKNTDCSGLIQASLRAHGINVGRTTYQQWKQGTPVNPKNLQAGDAVFFHMGGQGPEHVGMYIGGGRFIEDPHTGSVVRISNLSTYPGFVGARRYI